MAEFLGPAVAYHSRGNGQGRSHQCGSGSGSAAKKKRSLCVLSCSHVFHSACILAFEAFNIYELLLCPLCRDPYRKCPEAFVFS